MSHIPDARTDEYYNERYLSPQQTVFMCGYDGAIEDGKSFFANFDAFDLDVDVRPSDISAVADALSSAYELWMEAQRNVNIMSMIDSQNAEQYKANVEAAGKDGDKKNGETETVRQAEEE